MKCIACHQKIKISQVVITAPIGDICCQCARDGWEFYETGHGPSMNSGHGLALRLRTPEQRQEAAIRQLPLWGEAA